MPILIDFSNIARACWHPAVRAQEADSKYDAHQVFKGNLVGKMDTIAEGVGAAPDTFIMCKDDRAEWKRIVFAGYKANRDPNDFDPRPEAEAFLRLRYPNMKWAYSPGNEADDVIATLVGISSLFPDSRNNIVVVSSDQDLWQLLRPGVRVFLPSKRKFVDAEMVAEEYGVSNPTYIRLCKAFWGDTSDNLPNCLPRMQKQMRPLIEAAGGDLAHAIMLVPGLVNETCLGHLRKNLDQILINWELTKLKTDAEILWQKTPPAVKE